MYTFIYLVRESPAVGWRAKIKAKHFQLDLCVCDVPKDAKRNRNRNRVPSWLMSQFPVVMSLHSSPPPSQLVDFLINQHKKFAAPTCNFADKQIAKKLFTQRIHGQLSLYQSLYTYPHFSAHVCVLEFVFECLWLLSFMISLCFALKRFI